MPNLTKLLGGPKLWIKRDDCTGLSTGGNKTRKLEFLIGDALSQNANTVVTVGATQSNHARQTAAACARAGLDCTILLEDRTHKTDRNHNYNGNVLLDLLHGADVQRIPANKAVADAVEECLSALRSASAKEIVRLSTYVNETDIRYDGFKHFAELVDEKTGGEIEVQIFPSATLHGWSEGIDAVQGGVSDISWIPADDRLSCYRVTSLYPALINLENQVELDAEYASLILDEAAEN